jgi:hypothetical protein
MRKAMNGTWIAVLLHLLLLPTELHAQVKDAADATPQGRSLEICNKEAVGEEEGDYPCDEFIEANIEDNADTVKWLLDEIKIAKRTLRKAATRSIRETNLCNGLWLSWPFCSPLPLRLPKHTQS